MKFSEARGIEQLKELKDNLNRNGGGSTYLPKKLQKKEVIEPLEVIDMAQPEDKAKVTTPEPKEWDNLDEFEVKDGSKFWVKNPSNFFTVAKERGSADDITQKFLPNDKTKLTIEHPKNEMGKILVIDGALNTIKNSEIYFHIEKSGGGRLQSGVLEREEFISKMKDSEAEYIPEKKESEAPKERRLKLIEKPAKNSIINNMPEKIKPDTNPEKKTIKKSSEKVKNTIDKKSPEAVPPENINLKQSDLDLQDDVYVIVGRFKHYLDEKLLKVKGNEDEEKAIKELLANFEENPYSFVKKYKKDASGSKKLSKVYREENADDARTIALALKKEIPLKRKGIKINENLALDIGSAINDPIIVSLINKYVKKEATSWEVESVFQKGDNVYLYVKNGNGVSERIGTKIISDILATKENIITSKATKEENLKNIKELFETGGPYAGDVFTMEEKGFPKIKYTITNKKFGKIFFTVDENVTDEKSLYISDVLKAFTRIGVSTTLDSSNRKEISEEEKSSDSKNRVARPKYTRENTKESWEAEFASNVNYYLEDKKALEDKFTELENAPKEKTEAEILQNLLKEIGKEVEITDEILNKELKTKKGILSITKLQEKFDLSDDASNIIDKYDETLEKQKEMLAGSVNNKVTKEKLKIEKTKLDRRLSLLISSAEANGKNDEALQALGLISREDVKKNKLREIENSIINLTVNFNKRDKERTDKYEKIFTDITNKIDVEKNSDILNEIGEESLADKNAFENAIKNLKEKKAEINGTNIEVNTATKESTPEVINDETTMGKEAPTEDLNEVKKEFFALVAQIAELDKSYNETMAEIDSLKNAKSAKNEEDKISEVLSPETQALFEILGKENVEASVNAYEKSLQEQTKEEWKNVTPFKAFEDGNGKLYSATGENMFLFNNDTNEVTLNAEGFRYGISDFRHYFGQFFDVSGFNPDKYTKFEDLEIKPGKVDEKGNPISKGEIRIKRNS